MRVQAITADITTLEVDVIVNATNNAMIIGGGVDGAIHAAAGQGLINYNAQYHGFGCPTGQVEATPGFNLPAKFIYHTVGPDMRVYGDPLGNALLTACYNNCMMMAIKEGIKSIAFPAISTGIFGFDKRRAAAIAAGTVLSYADEAGYMDVTFACFADEDTTIVNEAIESIDERIHQITWSIGEYPKDNPDRDAAFIPDLDTDAPDGIYDVISFLGETEGRSHGVTVKDGKFVLKPTLRACAEARNDAGYWGYFLEVLKFYPEDDTAAFFQADFGS